MSFTPGIAGERFGASVDARDDYDGDGTLDFVVGSPTWNSGAGTEHGRVVVLSGAKLLNHASPTELASLTTPSATTTPQDVHFGAAVRASPDLTGDGIGEILVGAPEYKTIVPLANHRGAAVVYSGATFARLGTLLGGTADSLGDALLGGFADFDGDGFLEFIAAGSRGDAPALNCGTLQCVSLYPAFASTYCTAKTNSLGCVPSIAGNGSASVSSTAASLITCSNQINQKIGLLLYSHHPASLAFQGGTLCVQSPLSRTAQQSSGGSASGSDCTGAFGFDFNARIDSGVDATLVAGAQIFCQYWSRDPGSASTTSLSNGLNFLVNP